MADWRGQGDLQVIDGLGVYAAARYRHFRDAVEARRTYKIDHALFGLLLSAESMRDEMRAYEKQTSWLLRLAQTGHFVRQIRRLHGVLDAMSSQYAVRESKKMNRWKTALEQERNDRVKRYDLMLTSLASSDLEHQNVGRAILSEIESEEQQEEVLTLLKTAVDKYGDGILTPEEIETTMQAFRVVADRSNMVVVTPPSWLVMPFEFSSSFGLSRWGNDVFRPDAAASDKTQLIRDANVWSGLNHPHVAKFLGACHLGSRPFIVHERVRTLNAYLSEMKDREQVWQRVYEIALALQYLHERGLSCTGRLTVKNAFCAKCEDKAMVLGAGLQAFDVRRGDSISRDPEARQSSQAADDIERLCVLIVSCLRKLSSPASSDMLQVQLDDQKGRSGAKGFDLMPSSRPNFVDEAKWAILSRICQVGADTTAPMLYVIEHLKEAAGIGLDRDRFDESDVTIDTLQATRGDIEINSLVVPALGRLSIADVLDGCTRMIDVQSPAGYILSRLRDIHLQIKALRLTFDDDSKAKELVVNFASLLVRLHRSSEQASCSDGSSELSQFSMSQKKHASVFSFHMDIDRLLAAHNLSSANKVHNWKPDWAELSSKAHFIPLSALIQPPSSHGAIHTDVIQKRDVKPPSELASALSSMNRDDEGLTSEQDSGGDGGFVPRASPTLKKWFISPTEVEFKSYSEFSRGAFGSVHHGKWFDTRVVVKSVFTDTGDRKQIQLQFLQEADTWFQLNHINVVKMYGACHIGQPLFVCEFASGGDLSSYLCQKNREPYLIWYCLLNAALGLQYLHDKGIVHADLKANNILVGTDGIAKLADFGLSVSGRRGGVNDGGSGSGGGALGAYRWKAPECLPWKGVPGKAATFASDVYSFAMVMIEVASGKYPWGDMPDAAVKFHVKNGRLAPQPTEIADPEWRLIKRMCCSDPSERVSIDAVVVHLLSLLVRLDLDLLRSPIDGRVAPNKHKNHVISRGGALLSLVGFAKSENSRLTWCATEHLIAVQVHRGARLEKQEIDVVIELVQKRSATQKSWAARALQNLSVEHSKNQMLIASSGGISPLVVLVRDGNDVQKNAAAALRNLSMNAENKVVIASCGGIPPLVALVRDGNDVQKKNAVAALRNLSMNVDNMVTIASCGGISALVALVRYGNVVQKENAVAALRNLRFG